VDKQKIILLSLLIVLMVCGMALTIFIASNMGKQDEKEKPQKPNITQIEEKVREKHSVDKTPVTPGKSDDVNPGEEADSPKETLKAKDIFKRPEKTNTEEVSEQDARRYENSARELFRAFEFVEGSESLYEAIRTYKEEGRGMTLHVLYQDASILANLGHSHEEEEEGDEGHVENIEGILSILSGVRDPEMALLGTLSLDLQERNAVIPSLDSLNPIFDGRVQVIDKEEERGSVFDTLSVMYDVKTLHRITFMVDGFSLVAYVIEDSQGYSHVNSIYESEKGSTHYLTVRKWEELFKKESQSKKSAPKSSESELKTDTYKEGGDE